jgi:YbbR domain-containing protein
VEGVAVEPTRVLLRGGDSEIGGLAGVRTRPVSVAQASTDVEERVGLEMEGLHLLEVSPSKVWVRVKIIPLVMERGLDGVAVRLLPPEAKASVSPAKVKVFLKGPTELVEGLKEMDLQVTVNAQGVEPGKHTVSVGVVAPEGIQVVKVEPPRVEITMESN